MNDHSPVNQIRQIYSNCMKEKPLKLVLEIIIDSHYDICFNIFRLNSSLLYFIHFSIDFTLIIKYRDDLLPCETQ